MEVYNKDWSYHIAHEEVTDPSGILTVGLVTFLGLGILGMRKGSETGLLQDVDDRNLVLAGGFHTDLKTGVFGEPVSQLPQTFGKGRGTGLLILCKAVRVGNPDAGIDPGLVDIKPTAIFTKDFKANRNASCKKFAGQAGTGHPAKNECISEEISLRATCLRHSLMP